MTRAIAFGSRCPAVNGGSEHSGRRVKLICFTAIPQVAAFLFRWPRGLVRAAGGAHPRSTTEAQHTVEDGGVAGDQVEDVAGVGVRFGDQVTSGQTAEFRCVAVRLEDLVDGRAVTVSHSCRSTKARSSTLRRVHQFGRG